MKRIKVLLVFSFFVVALSACASQPQKPLDTQASEKSDPVNASHEPSVPVEQETHKSEVQSVEPALNADLPAHPIESADDQKLSYNGFLKIMDSYSAICNTDFDCRLIYEKSCGCFVVKDEDRHKMQVLLDSVDDQPSCFENLCRSRGKAVCKYGRCRVEHQTR